ncbi:hypothetical protein ACYCFK_17830 [Stutzerimonas stutzeri]
MAVYPVAAGQADYSSTGDSRFIPQIWSGKLIEKLYARTCFAEIANTLYEGEIKNQGDTVIIRTTPTITIRDHAMGAELNYEQPESAPTELRIDKGKYFAFECDDVAAYQADIKLMDNWSEDGGQQMKISIDTSVLSTIYADAGADNSGANAGAKSGGYNLGTAADPVELNKDNVLDYIADIGSVLDEQNVPEDGRWLVIPAWVKNLLKKSDLRDAGITGDATSVIRNGKIGVLDNFTTYVSNNMAVTAGNTNIVFGHKKSLTFASQMTKMETLVNPKKFGKLVRGLNVYGYKVIDPLAMGHLVARKA